jgi:hypothetical protein
MSTATQGQGQRHSITQESSALDQAIQATERVQSIRNTAAQFLGVPPEKVCDLLRNVWRTSKDEPPLSDAEMFMGMSMISRFGLDPIAKEVYVTRSKGKVMWVVGIDGWIKVLNRVEDFDGFEQSEEWDEKGNLLCVETRIYTTKRSRPTMYRGYAKEYMRMGGIVAEKMPWHMLKVFSLRHAARLFCPVGGSVVTEEEARWMDAYSATPEDDRIRKPSLKEKVAQASREFEPIPAAPREIPLTKEEAALPFQPPTAEEIKEAQGQAVETIAGPGAPEITPQAPPPAPAASGGPTSTETDPKLPGPAKIPEKAAEGPTEREIVENYKKRIAECTCLKDANRLVTAAGNDPLIPKLLSPPAIEYLGSLLQGAVTKWKQMKAQKSLV